VATIFLDNPVY